MNNFSKSLVLITLGVGLLGFTDSASVKAQTANEEFRATWVITWEHISGSSSASQNKARARQILDNHVEANMNAVLWQVRQGGTAYYTSSYEPWGYYAGSNYPGYDPLAYVIEEAHKRGLEVHAWFNTFHTSSDAPGTPVNEHPEWICRDGYNNPMSSNYAISPGLPEVRDYTLDVAMEIVNNYDIDGLHLDYVRWNEYTNSLQSEEYARTARQEQFLDGMITPGQVEELQRVVSRDRYLYDVQHSYTDGIPAGFSSWEEWWRTSVTTFVEMLHDSIQAVKPWVRLSVAALGNYRWGGWQGFGTVYQDAALWFNQGYIDQLTPMHYHWTTGNGFYDMLAGSGTDNWEYWITQGISDGRLFTVGPGSYILLQNDIWGRHPGIINRSRDVSWTDGFQFFSYGSWNSADYWEAAGNTVFPAKTKIRDTGLIDSVPPDAPAVSLVQLDSLHYQITIDPPGSILESQWFAVYRSSDDQFEVDTDPIVSIKYNDSSFVTTQNFSGVQDYNGQYHYFATTLDRYWNESTVSNSVMTDSIPSFAPVVNNIYPQAGDTIPINSELWVTFSKTMDTSSVEGSIALDPPVNLNLIGWAEDNKTIVFQPSTSLEYDTQYSLTISDNAADINGKALDGDADGSAGGNYAIQFRTLEQDITGPSVTESFPAQSGSTTEFDVDEVLTVVFDEIIDAATVNESSITLTSDNTPVEFGYNLVHTGDVSVLGVQPLNRFSQSGQYALTLESSITDTVGNLMENSFSLTFQCSPLGYATITSLDEFFSVSSWHEPEYSGSTTGIVDTETNLNISTDVYLPNSPTRSRKSAELAYQWDPEASSHLLRLYLMDGSDPKSVLFDSTYTLQLHVFGDASNNLFRFALDDGTGGSATAHEVSAWEVIDWIGWRIVEWDLGDPNSFGSWIGNQQFDSPDNLRFDSIQMGYGSSTPATHGRIYFDNLRIVKKTSDPVAVRGSGNSLPSQFLLHQNYPNPFNNQTTITFELPREGRVGVAVFNMRGEKVQDLLDAHFSAGSHSVVFDGQNQASGIYFYRITYRKHITTKRMLLLK